MEDLETVTSLSGVKSLPGEKDGKMVNVPLELIGNCLLYTSSSSRNWPSLKNMPRKSARHSPRAKD